MLNGTRYLVQCETAASRCGLDSRIDPAAQPLLLWALYGMTRSFSIAG